MSTYKSLADIADEYGSTPLHYASQRDDVECLQALLDRNCTPNVVDTAKATPLHNAAHEGRIEVYVRAFVRMEELLRTRCWGGRDVGA